MNKPKMYKITVSTDEDKTYYPDKPYFWCILGYYEHDKNNGSWCNEGCGWSESPDQAFKDAMEYHKRFHIDKK